jgi:CBS domain-containing protein
MTAPAARRTVAGPVPPDVGEQAMVTGANVQPFQGSYLTPTFEHATVADAMHPGILSCPPNATLTAVARVMATHRIHCVAVMGIPADDHGESLVWGIITDLDIVKARLKGDAEPTAGELAVSPAVTIETGEPLRTAAQMMAERGLTHLVVVSAALGRPVGILSGLDVAGVLAGGQG